MTIYLMMLIACLSQIGYGGSRVATSLYALELNANQFSIGAMVALYSLCPMLFAIMVGKFADTVSPRTPMFLGLIGVAAGLALPALFPGLATLYLMAFALGLCNLFYAIPMEVIVGGIDGPQHRARNYALISMAWAIANLLGPLIAGFAIDGIGHVLVFPLLAVFALIPALMLWFMPRLLPQRSSRTNAAARRSTLDLWRTPYLPTTFITAGIMGSAQDLFQFYMPIYGHSLNFSASAIGAILSMVFVAAFLMRTLLPWLLRRYTEPRILIATVFTAAFAYLALPTFANPYALAAIAFVLGLGVGVAQPLSTSLLYALAPAHRIAEAIGVHRTVRNGSQLFIPVFFGSVGTAFGVATVFLSNAALLAAGGMLLRKLRVPDHALRTNNKAGTDSK